MDKKSPCTILALLALLVIAEKSPGDKMETADMRMLPKDCQAVDKEDLSRYLRKALSTIKNLIEDTEENRLVPMKNKETSAPKNPKDPKDLPISEDKHGGHRIHRTRGRGIYGCPPYSIEGNRLEKYEPIKRKKVKKKVPEPRQDRGQQHAGNDVGLGLLTYSLAAALAFLKGDHSTTSTTTTQSVTAAATGTSSTTQQGLDASLYQHPQGAVCLVYGLCLKKMNPNRLFNLFCLYGNVVRVKFLKVKEGYAMVQMDNELAVKRVIKHLNNSTFFGTEMQLGISKQTFIADVQSPYQLPDGSNNFQDFMGSKNNRYNNLEMTSKNRIQEPSKILHFFNLPWLESSDINANFVTNGAPKPKVIKMFPLKKERSPSSGLIEFETLPDALEGLIICNHQPIPNHTGIMKLCFSSRAKM